jgi:hypothetical protein
MIAYPPKVVDGGQSATTVRAVPGPSEARGWESMLTIG